MMTVKYSSAISLLLTALLNAARDERTAWMDQARILLDLRDRALAENLSFKYLCRQAKWPPLKALRLIGVYRALVAKTLTPKLMAQMNWNKLLIIGPKLDLDPKSKEWVTKAKQNDSGKLLSMVRGEADSSAMIHESRLKLNQALCFYGAYQTVDADGNSRLYRRDEALRAMVDAELKMHSGPSKGKLKLIA